MNAALISSVKTAICIVIFFTSTLLAQTIFVDFGSTSGGNLFELGGWNTVLLSDSMSYTSDGPGGVILTDGFNEFSDYMGVQGTAREFSYGERIAATFYNTSATETIYFTSRISFTDSDQPDGGSSTGKWFTMRSFYDYRESYQECAPGDTVITVFNIEREGVHATEGTYNTVNINIAVEWGESYYKQWIVCDKIELMYDADTTVPAAPSGFTASPVSSSQIALDWSAASDDIGVVEYLIYKDGMVEGYTRSTYYVVSLLESGTMYSFTVTARDAAGNESLHSSSSSAATLPFQGDLDLINSAGITYLGAFILPESMSYGGDAIAYNPEGDGGQSGSGAGDGYPGSIYVQGLNQDVTGFVGELAIPAPVISSSKDINDLNEAAFIQSAVNIRPQSINDWEYVDIWRLGLEYLPQGDLLYSTWSIHYTVSGEKHATISFCGGRDLSGSAKYGAWYLGPSGSDPVEAMANDYLFALPQSWADSFTSGRVLVSGRFRDGGLSGLGPTLYAFAPVDSTTPPAALTELPLTTLLEYGDVAASDNYDFPNSIVNYNHADFWRGADWISAGNQSAVMFTGTKALGENWYGYQGQEYRNIWLAADVPYPDSFAVTDPDGKGWRANNYTPMCIFYDPDDLALVAAGSMLSYIPQPYAALRLDSSVFWGSGREISSAAYDEINERLYLTEFNAPSEGRLIVHVFSVDEVTRIEKTESELPYKYDIFQNYPNPFNPITAIKYQIPEPGSVVLKIYNIQGEEIAVLAEGYRDAGIYTVHFDGSNFPSGIYFYKIVSGEYSAVKKMILIK